MYAPVSGNIVEVNAGLDSSPETINSDAEGAGWIAKIKLSSIAELDSLMDLEAYKKHVKRRANMPQFPSSSDRVK